MQDAKNVSLEEFIKNLVKEEVEQVKKDEMPVGPKGDKGKESVNMKELESVITRAVKEGVIQALEEQQKEFFKKVRGGGMISGGFGV